MGKGKLCVMHLKTISLGKNSYFDNKSQILLVSSEIIAYLCEGIAPLKNNSCKKNFFQQLIAKNCEFH